MKALKIISICILIIVLTTLYRWFLGNTPTNIIKRRLASSPNVTIKQIRFDMWGDPIVEVDCKTKNKIVTMDIMPNLDNFNSHSYGFQKINEKVIMKLFIRSTIRNDDTIWFGKHVEWGIQPYQSKYFQEIFDIHLNKIEDIFTNAEKIDSAMNSIPEYYDKLIPMYYTDDSTIEMYYFKVGKEKYHDLRFALLTDTTLKFKHNLRYKAKTTASN